MTLGITGVFWLPRMAEANSIALNTGAHGVPITAAASAWGGLTAAWVDATATLTRVMAELGVGMQGVNGIAAIGRIAGFTSWCNQQSVLSAAMGTKAAANATAYTVASIAMPSLPEILGVNAAVVASANPPGVVSGTFEAAEIAKTLMDVRAALVMETYEAATTAMVTTPGEFAPPPAIANGAGGTEAVQAESAFGGDPVSAAVGAVASALNNPALHTAATQVANVAGTVASGGVGTVGNLGANAISAATAAAPGSPAMPVGMAPGVAGAPGSGTSTRSASTGVAVNPGSIRLPEGWGSGVGINSTPAAAPVTDTAFQRVDGSPVRSTVPTAGSPLLGGARSNGAEDDEHESDDYLSQDHFSDDRRVADGVIGAAGGTIK